MDNNEKINILKKLLPQYIPSPPASQPNTCIKIPIAFDSDDIVIDALHFVPASTRDNLIYIDYHSHQDKNSFSEGYSKLDNNTYTFKIKGRKDREIQPIERWTQLNPVGNLDSRIYV